MQQQSARAAISANSLHGAQRATCRPGHCLTHQARCALRHESVRWLRGVWHANEHCAYDSRGR
eukprot:3483877-Pleurochrysis_carterae.AAC.1